MHVVYTGEEAPNIVTKSIFLAGPSPRKATDGNWRPDAIKALEKLGFDGVVYAPIFRNGPPKDSGKPFDYDGQLEWETKYLNQADLIVFWVPRDMKTLPALTTNIEFGMWLESGKVLLGYPGTAEQMTYLGYKITKEGTPPFDTLPALMYEATLRLWNGAARTGGERDVPLGIWLKPEFQEWYLHHRGVGNRLDGATVKWACRVGKNKEKIFAFVLHVNVWINAEDRNKINEIVIFRPSISTIVAYCEPAMAWVGEILERTEVVIVKEFRSPVNNTDSMVYELPGGSSFKPHEKPEVVAAAEMSEETGLTLRPDRFRPIGVRQLVAAFSTHRAHCYAVELTPQEMLALKWEAGKAHGNHEDSEYTFVEVMTVADMLKNPNIDWSTIGMVYQALKTA